MRDSTIIYRSFYEAIKELPKKNQADLWEAIFEYSLNFNEIKLIGISETVFKLIKPQLDSNIKKYKDGCKGKEYGIQGGRPKKNNPTETPQKPHKNPTETPNDNDNDNVNYNVNENVNVNINDVIKYFSLKGYTKESAIKFYNYYEAANWINKDGKEVKNWKLTAVQVWFKPENEKPKSKFQP